MVRNLTEGKPQRVLWSFTLPMFISVIFQQLYNIADSSIAGRFAGEDALAAIGASYPITMIFMAIAIGSNIGCSVIISSLFGGRRYRQTKIAIGTTLITTLVLSLVLTAVGIMGSRQMLLMIQTPENIFADGALYLRIYIGGFLFLFLYNVVTGIFTSLGDSKTPLYFLIGSSLGNIVLDLLFVTVIRGGVAGVAWATFIAQGAACLLSLAVLRKRLREIPYEGEYEKFSFSMLLKISTVAVPSILQQSFVSVGNLLIQGLINSFGSSVIAGYSAAIKLNTFTITSFTTLGNGVSSFTAQNLGAGEEQRVKQGFAAGVKMAVVVATGFFVLYFFLTDFMLSLFLREGKEAMEAGSSFLKIVAPFYPFICAKLIADGVLRGGEAMKHFMAATFSDLILRVILAFIFVKEWGYLGIWYSWPVGWVIATVMSVIFYKQGVWKPYKRKEKTT